MSVHSMEVYQRADSKWSWRVKVGDDVVASDASQGYERKRDCLHSMFGLWFADWNESFLTHYQEWQSYAGEAYEVPPEAQEGPPVRIQTSMPEGSAQTDPITARQQRAEDDGPHAVAEESPGTTHAAPPPDGLTDSSE